MCVSHTYDESMTTGDLPGLTGTITSSSTHEDCPHMPMPLSYDIE